MRPAACAAVRRALHRARDLGESPDAAVAGHLDACADCRDHGAILEAAGERLRERGGPALGLPDDALREAVLGRIRRGDAAALEMRPFLLRVAMAAAAVAVLASAATLLRDAPRRPDGGRDGAFLAREDVLAGIVREGLLAGPAPAGALRGR